MLHYIKITSITLSLCASDLPSYSLRILHLQFYSDVKNWLVPSMLLGQGYIYFCLLLVQIDILQGEKNDYMLFIFYVPNLPRFPLSSVTQCPGKNN